MQAHERKKRFHAPSQAPVVCSQTKPHIYQMREQNKDGEVIEFEYADVKKQPYGHKDQDVAVKDLILGKTTESNWFRSSTSATELFVKVGPQGQKWIKLKHCKNSVDVEKQWIVGGAAASEINRILSSSNKDEELAHLEMMELDLRAVEQHVDWQKEQWRKQKGARWEDDTCYEASGSSTLSDYNSMIAYFNRLKKNRMETYHIWINQKVEDVQRAHATMAKLDREEIRGEPDSPARTEAKREHAQEKEILFNLALLFENVFGRAKFLEIFGISVLSLKRHF